MAKQKGEGARGHGDGVSRREVLSSAIAALGTAGLGTRTDAASADSPVPAQEDACAATAHSSATAAPKERYVTVTEGTNIAAVVSPDAKTIAFDLYSALWLVGVEGGAARRLTDDLADIAQPDWSPDGKTLVFQSYRDGNFHLWSIGSDGAGLTQLTRGPYDCREPRFAPDGRSIAFSSDRPGHYAVHILDVASGNVRQLTSSTAQEAEPAWSPDGTRIALVADNTKLQIVDSEGTISTLASIQSSSDPLRKSELHAPGWTPDGKALIYSVLDNGTARLVCAGETLVSGEDVFPFRVSWLGPEELLYTSSGKMRRLSLTMGKNPSARGVIEFTATVPVVTPTYRKRSRDFSSTAAKPVVGVGSPVLSHDGHHVAFRALNDLWTMKIGSDPRPLLRDRFYKSDPAWSPDGRKLAYSSDRGAKLDIWIRDLQTGEDRQLTQVPMAAVSSAWSPDGSMIAFLDQTGSLHTLDVSSGAVRKVFDALWEPGRPTWGPDGHHIAMAAFKPYSARYREGLSEILVIDLTTGAATYTPPLPNRSLSTRGDDGPVWSPDGTRMAFVLGSTLWVVPVDRSGRFTGEPKQITREVTDAPSWGGDSQTLLYLSNGKLRLVSANGGEPRDVPLRMSWRNATPTERTILRVGRVWEGFTPEYRSNVDVVIEGNRIAALMPSSADRPSDKNARFVDARDRTLMPGLVDMHTHRQMQGYSYGDRQGRLWLAMGVTSTRSPGAPAYHMVEDREAIDSGNRLGPRHFATGEAIDGSRIFYNFMRPVTEPGQMELELQRAAALSYDMIKTYVRLAPEQQQKVIAWAHAKGMHVSSHYHFPALRFGCDCMEHLGATNRLGYSRTVTALGAAYQDVDSLFVNSQAGRTPTLFTSTALLGEDRSLVDDARIKTLYPSWEYARLLDRATQMANSNRTPLLSTLERNVMQVKAMLRSGGRVLSGTDAPIDFVAVSLHLNLRGMVKYGLTPYEALLTATRFPGEFLAEPLGTVTVGAFADLLLIDGDPLARIEDAAAVRTVIKNGELFTVPELMGPFAPRANLAANGGRPLDGGAARSATEAQLSAALEITDARPTQRQYWWHDPDYVESSRGACCANHFSLGLFSRRSSISSPF